MTELTSVSNYLQQNQIISNSGVVDGPAHQMTILKPDGIPAQNVLVALYKSTHSGRVAIDQGLTRPSGAITIYGAIVSDVVRAATFDGAYAGQQQIDSREHYTLTISPISANKKDNFILAPYLNLIPSSNGDALSLLVHQVPVDNLTLNARVIPADGGGEPQLTSLVYNDVSKVYIGHVSFGGVGLGSGKVQVSSAAGGPDVTINSDYNLQQVAGITTNQLYSEDGNFSLHLPANSISVNKAYATVAPVGYVPYPLPIGRQIIGSGYEVRLSGALAQLEKQAIVGLYHHPKVTGSFTSAAICHWNAAQNQWDFLGGELNVLTNQVVTTTKALGIYALMGEVDVKQHYLPIIMKP